MHAHGLALAIELIAPQGGMRATAVIAHIVVGHGQAETREEQRLARVVEHGVVGVGHGKYAPRVFYGVDGGDDAARCRAIRILRADQHLALRRPAQHQHAAIVI
ncbi:hypothetical protein D3C81_1791670 [compost metagenome]